MARLFLVRFLVGLIFIAFVVCVNGYDWYNENDFMTTPACTEGIPFVQVHFPMVFSDDDNELKKVPTYASEPVQNNILQGSLRALNRLLTVNNDNFPNIRAVCADVIYRVCTHQDIRLYVNAPNEGLPTSSEYAAANARIMHNITTGKGFRLLYRVVSDAEGDGYVAINADPDLSVSIFDGAKVSHSAVSEN